MRKLLRQTVYLLLLTLMSNAVGWTFNQEAIAAPLFGEQRASVASADQPADRHDDSCSGEHQHACNHWCHAAGHFMGLTSQAVFVLPELVDIPVPSLQTTLLSHSSNDLYRPPRTILA
ncbi:MAG: hypothetical protein WAW02_02665 [Sideroxyarcus sp.]